MKVCGDGVSSQEVSVGFSCFIFIQRDGNLRLGWPPGPHRIDSGIEATITPAREMIIFSLQCLA